MPKRNSKDKMGAIDFYPNFKTRQSIMFHHRRRAIAAIAGALVNNPKNQVALINHPRTISSPSPFLANVRTTVAMKKDPTVVGGPRDLEPIFQQKQCLRSKIRKALKNMDPIERSQQDNEIQRIVLDAPWFKESKSLCAYISCASLREVDTSKIVSQVLSNPFKEGNGQGSKRLYVPRVEDRNSNMRMLRISTVDDLIANSMNILEPTLVDSDGNQHEDVIQACDAVDLFILPGLAFDRSGRRLGRGGGYYDVFLKKYQELAKEWKWKQPLLVALSYSLQILEEGAIPVTPYDIPLDALVSPAGFIPISPTATERCE